MKKIKLPNKRKLIVFALIIVAFVVYMLTRNNSMLETYKQQVTLEHYVEAYMLLEDSENISYQRFLNSHDIDYSLQDYETVLVNTPHSEAFGYASDVALLQNDTIVEYQVTVEEKGLYQLNLDYYVDSDVLNDVIISVLVNGEQQYNESDLVVLPLFWQDVTKEFDTDRYDDELPPSHERIVEWMNQDLYDNRYTTDTPLVFELEDGSNTIQFSTTVLHYVYLGDLNVIALV